MVMKDKEMIEDLRNLVQSLKAELKLAISDRDSALKEAVFYRHKFFSVRMPTETQWQSRCFVLNNNYFGLSQEQQVDLLKQEIVYTIREMNRKITHEEVLVEFLRSKTS